MTDRFGGFSASVSSPATRSTPIVKGDAELNPIPKALLVGAPGSIVGRLLEDQEDRTFEVQAGYHPLRFKIIRAASTAGGMIGLD